MSAHADRERVRYGQEAVDRGHGGETHQTAGGDRPSMTTQQGVVVADDQNTLRWTNRPTFRQVVSFSGTP